MTDAQLGELAHSQDIRLQFAGDLGDRLAKINLELGSCHLGRSSKGDLVWLVSFRLPTKEVVSVEADFPPDAQAYSADTLEALVRRITTHFYSFWANRA